MTDSIKAKGGVPVTVREANQEHWKEKVEDSTVAPPPAVENVVTRDGFRLHPQPTSDELDPLNWSFFQKHTILAIVMFK